MSRNLSRVDPEPAPVISGYESPKLRCWAEIDLGVLERNLKRIRAALPSHIKYLAVVKADAYGHGMRQTVSRLMRSGTDMFAVANIGEAAEIREIGSGWPILALSALLPEEDKYISQYQIIPTISSADEVERFCRVGQAADKPIPVHLKIDTGMGRLGVWHEEASALYKKIRSCRELVLEGIFTHFSSAGTDPEFSRSQRELFLNALSCFPDLQLGQLLIHADNSAGLEFFSSDEPFNAVRVGLLQFGVRPYPESFLGRVRVEPVFSFHSRVGLVKNLPAGTGISYGGTYRLQRVSRIAVLTAGYGDGIPTTVSNIGEVLIQGRRCKILGRVTMDQTIVDITDLPNVSCGEKATLIGRQGGEEIDVTTFSTWAKSIPWETFCSITKRVQRIYRTDTAV